MGLVILLLIVIGIVAIVVASRDRHREVDAKIALLEAQVEDLKRESPTDQNRA